VQERIGIVGLGLIGGSLARSLRRARPEVPLYGVDSDARARELALAAGAVDEAAPLESAELERCSLVVLAVPAAPLVELIEPVARRLPPGAVLTDVCGAKEEICRRAAGQDAAVFVGGHPMAGTEFRGFEAASATLFAGAVVALCPPVGGPAGADAEAAVQRVESLWRAAGAARLLRVEPELHDRAVTYASHLPYLAAASVVDSLHSAGGATALASELTAGGFRDTTRVAGDWTISGALALNRFLPEAARALADHLARLAEELRRDPERAVARLRALADERRAMVLPPRPGAGK
jgi:prephenate dehydrogenase